MSDSGESCLQTWAPLGSTGKLLEFNNQRFPNRLRKKLQSRKDDSFLQLSVPRLSQGVSQRPIDSQRARRPDALGDFAKKRD